MWTHSGRIFINAARVYYLPDEESLPPLQWRAETQRFVFVSAENDAMMRSTLINLADIATPTPATPPQRQFPTNGWAGSMAAPGGPGSSFVSSVDTVSNSIACECLYGVVPIGYSSSVLLYISKKSHVTSLPLPEQEDDGSERDGARMVERRRHEVYLVRKMDWMLLPSRVPRSQSCLATPMVSAADGRPMSQEAASGAAQEGYSDDDDENAGSISDEVLREYLRVIDRFCAEVSKRNGEQSHLYYSPTLNLALSPEEMLKGHLRAQPEDAVREEDWREVSLASVLPPSPPQPTTGRGSSRSDEERETNSRTVFQWNHMLLRGFLVPQRQTDLENQMNLAASTKIMRRGVSSFPPASVPTSAAASGAGIDERDSAVYPWSCVRMTDAHGSPRFNAMMLYVPCFIRGLVAAYDVAQEMPSALPTIQLHLITRLSCRWAGTRYNRRGLEPSNSGVVANCAVTSLWVSTAPQPASLRRDRESEPNAGKGGVERLAVLNLLRGSVPRRWEQPADMHFKPPLKVLYPNNAVDEVMSHLSFLQGVLPNVKKVACVDTTSTSWLEGPLSTAYATAVKKVQRNLLRNMPFEPLEEGEESEEEGEGKDGEAAETMSTRTKRSPQVAQIALNERTPLSYVKFDMKRKLKAFRYGDLRRNVVAEMVANKVGIFPNRLTSAGGTTTTTGPAKEPETLPSWVDFTRCSYSTLGTATEPSLRWQGLYYRVNCLDCLDRTNLFQAMLAESTLPFLLRYVLGESDGDGNGKESSVLEDQPTRQKLHVAVCTAMRRMLAQQGIAISQMYANSEAHFLAFLLGSDLDPSHNSNNESTKYRPSLDEGMLALRRWFYQNFRDGGKQDGISLVTLQHDPSLYPSDIESPFSRDLTSMNKLVLYGLLFAVVPFVFSVVSYLFLPASRTERHVHLALCVGWLMYFAFLYQKLSKYRASYTNQPLLSSTWNC